MRLFIALDVNENLKKYLFDIQNKLFIDNVDIRLSLGFHLTLKFLGEKNNIQTENIIQKLSDVKYNKFTIFTKGIGFFKKNNKIKIIWCGIEPKKEIIELKKLIDEKLSKPIIKDDKAFFPHITLARVKKIINQDKFIENIKKIEKKELLCLIDSFVLYKSTLTPHGPIYNVIERFKLN
jgi:RNA 2',3'-cyclic 3'-phosphodiesterase